MADNIQAVGIEFDPRDFERAIQRANRRLDQLEDAFDDSVRASKRQGDAFDGLAKKALGLAAAYGLFRGAQRAAQFLFDTNVEFQQLEARLISITGSVEEAQSAFQLITDFARSTPFEVSNLTQAFTQLSSVGIEPTVGHLQDLGNFAAAMGRDITDFTNAVTRAATGETEALKAFGIVARSEGDRLRVTFRGVTHEVERDFVPVVELFRQLARENFGDAMGRQMQTLGGAISNLRDSSALLAKEIGEQGLNAEISRLVKTLDQAIQDGDAFAKVLGESLAAGVRVGTDALEVFIEHANLIVTAFESLGSAAVVGGIAALVRSLRTATIAAGGLSAALASNPATLILTLAAAIGGPLLIKMIAAREEAETLAETLERLGSLSVEESVAEVGNEALQATIRQLEERRRQLQDQQSRFARAAAAAPEDSALQKSFRRDFVGTIAEIGRVNQALADARGEFQRRITLPAIVSGTGGTEGVDEQAEALDKLRQSLEQQRIEIEQGERAAFAFKLAQDGIVGAAREEALALFDAVRAAEAEKKAAEDAVKVEEQRKEGIDRILESLAEEEAQLTRTREELVRLRLEQLGATDADIEAAEKRVGNIRREQEAQEAAEERRRQAQAELEAQAQQAQADADRMAQTFGDAFVDIVTGTEDVGEAFHRMVNQILADLARIAIREVIVEPLGKALGGILGGVFGGIFGGPFGAAAGAVSGAAAHGANVHPGERFIVGERGPEVFEAGRTGQIRPIEVNRGGGEPVTIVNRLDLDVSRLPRAADPRQQARDAEWIRFLSDSLREWEAGGGTLSRN